MKANNENKFTPLLVDTKQIKSLRDIVLESLRENIIAGKFKPGEHLKERELAEAMGISTTPVKEALRILGHEGLVETLPRKGTFVSEVVDTSIEEILMLKASLESLSARLAAKKISEAGLLEMERQINLMETLAKSKETEKLTKENTKFHMSIREAAKNPVIYKMLMNVVAFDNAFRKRALEFNLEIREGFAEHKKIFEAIKERNEESAEKRMKEHILRTAETVLNHLKD